MLATVMQDENNDICFVANSAITPTGLLLVGGVNTHTVTGEEEGLMILLKMVT